MVIFINSYLIVITMRDSMEIPFEIALEMLAKKGTGPYTVRHLEDYENLSDYQVTQVMNGADPKVVLKLPIGVRMEKSKISDQEFYQIKLSE
jgi:hypothetical protein